MNAGDRSIQALFEKADRGDRSAIGRLLERHRDRLRAAISARIDRRLSGRVDPSDVVQEAFVEAGRRLPEYLRERPVGWFPWLLRLTLQRLIDVERFHLRSRKRSVVRESFPRGRTSDQGLDHLSDHGVSPSVDVIRAEERVKVRAALTRLSEADRRILGLRYFEGQSFAEIAIAMDISTGAAKMRHFRALERFNAIIAGDEGEPVR